MSNNESFPIVCPPSAPPPNPPPDFHEWSASIPAWFWVVFVFMGLSSLVGIFGVCAFLYVLNRMKRNRRPVPLDDALGDLERRMAAQGM